MKLTERIRILPLLVIVAMLCFTLRLGEFVSGVRHLDSAVIAAEPAAGPAPAPGEEEAKASEATDPEKKAAAPANVWADPASADLDNSENLEQILGELAARRKELDAREDTLNQREALLKATEQQIDQKLNELNTLSKNLETLLGKQKEEEDARTQSLVKIYEGMKPKEAARIFDTLEMEILLNVVSHMSERKSAPVLAAMDPERARQLTIMLAEQKKLPELPQMEQQQIRLP